MLASGHVHRHDRQPRSDALSVKSSTTPSMAAGCLQPYCRDVAFRWFRRSRRRPRHSVDVEPKTKHRRGSGALHAGAVGNFLTMALPVVLHGVGSSVVALTPGLTSKWIVTAKRITCRSTRDIGVYADADRSIRLPIRRSNARAEPSGRVGSHRQESVRRPPVLPASRVGPSEIFNDTAEFGVMSSSSTAYARPDGTTGLKIAVVDEIFPKTGDSNPSAKCRESTHRRTGTSDDAVSRRYGRGGRQIIIGSAIKTSIVLDEQCRRSREPELPVMSNRATVATSATAFYGHACRGILPQRWGEDFVG